METILIKNMDCLEGMKKMPANSVDSVITDPPAGISFMGKSWDTFDKSMFGKKGDEGDNDLKVKKNFEVLPRYGNADLQAFQDFICEVFTEVKRVLKPGGFGLVWAIPRTSHHTAMGLERAGFEIRDVVHHTFAQGFPKSRKVGEGVGTQLKPAVEQWILCRKPLSEKNVEKNISEWGTGGLNIDDCRIPYTPCAGDGTWNKTDGMRPFNNDGKTTNYVTTKKPSAGKRTATFGTQETQSGGDGSGGWEANNVGRFPANLLVSDDVLNIGENGDSYSRYFDLDKWSEKYPFLIVSKASKKDKNIGLPFNIKNIHPTVKSTKLMTYLIKLITPKDGVVLDPFAGSGTTLLAAKNLGLKAIGFEMDAEYCKIIEERLK